VVASGRSAANRRCRAGRIARSRRVSTTAVGTSIPPIQADESKRVIAAVAAVIADALVERNWW
jgi:hypothetical protein